MPKQATDKIPDIWGASSASFYAEMEGERLIVNLVDGKQVRGVLLGIDRYDLFLEEAGEKVLVAKGAITTIRRERKEQASDGKHDR